MLQHSSKALYMCGVASFPGSPPHDDGRVGGEPGNEAMCSVRVDMLVELCRNLNQSVVVCDTLCTYLHISLHVQEVSYLLEWRIHTLNSKLHKKLMYLYIYFPLR